MRAIAAGSCACGPIGPEAAGDHLRPQLRPEPLREDPRGAGLPAGAAGRALVDGPDEVLQQPRVDGARPEEARLEPVGRPQELAEHPDLLRRRDRRVPRHVLHRAALEALAALRAGVDLEQLRGREPGAEGALSRHGASPSRSRSRRRAVEQRQRRGEDVARDGSEQRQDQRQVRREQPVRGRRRRAEGDDPERVELHLHEVDAVARREQQAGGGDRRGGRATAAGSPRDENGSRPGSSRSARTYRSAAGRRKPAIHPGVCAQTTQAGTGSVK